MNTNSAVGSGGVDVESKVESEWSTSADGFLKFFDGNHIFVTMSDVSAKAPWHLYGDFKKDGVAETLSKKQYEGWGAFWTVNELNRELDPDKYRTGKMWVRSRAIFLDDDKIRDIGQFRKDWPLEPSLVVESSPGKFHYYWIIDQGNIVWDEFEKGEWQRIQLGLIYEYDGDRNARDLARYLRLPGSKNCKKFSSIPDLELNLDAQGRVRPELLNTLWTVRWCGSGIRYKWEMIKEYFPPIEMDDVRETARNNVTLKSGSKSLDTAVSEITSGINYHENLRDISWALKQEGMTDFLIIRSAQGWMSMVPDALKDDRWKARYDDIPRIVAGAEKEVRELRGLGYSLDELGKLVTKEEELRNAGPGEMPWPPGRLGGLAGEAYDMAIYQYREVACVSAIGLIAGIVGRKFNVSNTGLNVYLTLIMGTGMGKDSINKFINRTLIELNDFGRVRSFIGPSRITGPKGAIKVLEKNRSMVSVFTEAGLLLKSKSGDQAGLGRMLLSLYTKSGKNDWSGSESYSKEEDSIGSLRAPAFSIINEATPETLHEAFREQNLLERGDIPRQSVYRVSGDKPYANLSPKLQVNDEHKLRLSQLVAKCVENQELDDPKAHDLLFDPDILTDVENYARFCVDEENKYRRDNAMTSIMRSRAFVKALKFAGIASVYNHFEAVIKKPEWEWGKAMVEYEMAGIEHFFAGSSKSDESADLVRWVGGQIVKLFQNKFKSRKQQISSIDAKKGVFTASAVRQVCQNKRELKALRDEKNRHGNKYGSGVDIILETMLQLEYIRKYSDKPLKYIITEAFASIFGDR